MRAGNHAEATPRRGMRLAGMVFSLLAVSFFVYRGSYAAFYDMTDNTANQWAAGSVTLTNDPDGDGTFGGSTTAEFNESTLVPGDTGTGCIDVKYEGTITDSASLTNIALYIANLSDTDGGSDTGNGAKLSDDLDIVVNIYAATETCATLVPNKTLILASSPLATLPTSFGTGVDTGWKPSATNEVRAFEFTWTLGSDTANDAQGDSAQVDLVWEIQTP